MLLSETVETVTGFYGQDHLTPSGIGQLACNSNDDNDLTEFDIDVSVNTDC